MSIFLNYAMLWYEYGVDGTMFKEVSRIAPFWFNSTMCDFLSSVRLYANIICLVLLTLIKKERKEIGIESKLAGCPSGEPS